MNNARPIGARRVPADGARAFAAYAAIAVAMTWPLARGIAHDVPSDLGDPLLNAWILAWDADHLLAALTGHIHALAGYWQANIYYPHPYALAYSEHLTAQAIQILPVYALTRNPLVCYNLLFLSTFAISGLGMYLLARDLTGDRAAAFAAGLAFAFAPYRFGSNSHLQVLSSGWMPFVFLGFHRFFTTLRTRLLAGAATAWIAQNLSCSYYLLFFSPVVALYIAWELTRRGLWTNLRVVQRLAFAAATVGLVTVPFVVPYLRLRALGFMPRSLGETERYSADVYAYLTAPQDLRIWGRIFQAWPHSEGWLFPGVTIAALAAIALAWEWRRVWMSAAGSTATRRPLLHRAFGVACAVTLFAAAALMFGWSLHWPFLKITNVDRAVAIAAFLAVGWLATSARARLATVRWIASPVGMYAAVTLFAAAMSLGPIIHTHGRPIDSATMYSFFYSFVPGFDGLRVPARFGMIVAFGLAALVTFGLAALHQRFHPRAALLASILILVEASAIPLPMNGNDTNYRQAGLVPLPATVPLGKDVPAVYRFIAGNLPAEAAIIELPFGEVAFETRYMLYSTVHWRRLVNGYSGGAPVEYGLLVEALKEIQRRPDRAWAALVSSGALYLLVHEGSYENGRGSDISAWARQRGAREVMTFGSDRLFALP